jgi:hypothetical protein
MLPACQPLYTLLTLKIYFSANILQPLDSTKIAMPENVAIKCELCEGDVPAGEEIHSTSKYEAICDLCYTSMWSCDYCNELKPEDDESWEDVNSHSVCEGCRDDGSFYDCYGCSLLINTDRHEYYEANGDTCCHTCADDTEMDQCSNCGTSVYFNEVYSDNWESANQCYDCHNQAEEHISSQVTSTIAKADVTLADHYVLMRAAKAKQAQKYRQELQYFMDWYYRGDAAHYSNTDLYLIKSDKGFGAGFGFHESKIEIASQTFRTFADYLKDMMQRDLFIVEHKKYGLYHPLRDIFKSCITYYDRKGGGNVLGSDLPLEQVGKDWLGWSIENINVNAVVQMLQLNKTDDGADLKRALTTVFSRSYKNRIPAQYPDDSPFMQTLGKYRTNATCTTLPIKIGFDPSMFQQVAELNATVGSCQCKSNAESYGHGFMDLATNPHLWLLIYDTSGERLIGRSVLKFMKPADDWADKQTTTYIAPSRIYLSDYTQAKAEVYAAAFRAVDEWAKSVFKDYKLVGHTYSRHDTPTLEYLKGAPNIEVSDSEKALYTQWWIPFWLDKPSNDEANFTYYQDEDARAQITYALGNDLGADYAAREYLRASGYRLVEVT